MNRSALAGLWRDLTGQSERWLRTLVLAVVVGRLSLVTLGILILLAFGAGATDQYSGMIDAVTAEWVLVGLVFAPLVESLAIRLVVWVLGLRWPVRVTAAACALLSVPFHGLGPLSLAVAPFFALMATIQHHWMERGRGWAGFWLITAIHAAANGIALLGAALLELSAR